MRKCPLNPSFSDNWPAPYLAFTAQNTKESSDSDRAKTSLAIQGMDFLLNALPELREWIGSSHRDFSDEIENPIDHGTHVTGLIVYDTPEIGILPYRIFPFNEPWAQRDPSRNDINLIINSLEKAIEDGSRIIPPLPIRDDSRPLDREVVPRGVDVAQGPIKPQLSPSALPNSPIDGQTSLTRGLQREGGLHRTHTEMTNMSC